MAHAKRQRLHEVENSKDLSFLEKKIMKYLHDHSQSENTLHQTLKISHGIGMKTKKDVNSSLYSLQKKGFISKEMDSPPTWKLLHFEQSMHATVNPSLVPQQSYIAPSVFTTDDFPVNAPRSDVEVPKTSSSLNTVQQNSKNENVERHVLKILNINDTKSREEIRQISGSSIQAIDAALAALLQQNKVQKLGDCFSLLPQYFNAAQTIPMKNYWYGEPHVSNSFNAASTSASCAFVEEETVPKLVGTPVENIASTLKLPEGKNAISAINEYAQSKKLILDYDEDISGPDHMRRFQMDIIVGQRKFRGAISMTKKEAKLKAAEAALAQLYQAGELQSSIAVNAPIYETSHQEITIHDKVASLVIQKYNELMQVLPDTIVGRKIIAGFVVSKQLKSGESLLEVISIGSGNRCVAGDRLSLRGETVNDCHAEVIARRGLVRYLYKQIQTFNEGYATSPDCMLAPSGNRYKLKPGIAFHLYISTAPCGDSAIFAPSDVATDNPHQNIHDGSHHPLFENKKQGLLRTKVENGEGCIPIDEDAAVPTWDGLLRGERLRTMSCSDKIAKWNFLGLQGSLLTHFMDPIYLSTLTLGMLYNHGHLTRAICCRVEKFMQNVQDTMIPTQYTVHHPVVSGQQNNTRETGKIKTREFSVNWCLGDQMPEVLDGTQGKCEQRFGSTNPPRLCKAGMYSEFKKVCVKMNKPCGESYFKCKMAATAYQEAKALLCEAFNHNGFGQWMHKPKEEKDF